MLVFPRLPSRVRPLSRLQVPHLPKCLLPRRQPQQPRREADRACRGVGALNSPWFSVSWRSSLARATSPRDVCSRDLLRTLRLDQHSSAETAICASCSLVSALTSAAPIASIP